MSGCAHVALSATVYRRITSNRSRLARATSNSALSFKKRTSPPAFTTAVFSAALGAVEKNRHDLRHRCCIEGGENAADPKCEQLVAMKQWRGLRPFAMRRRRPRGRIWSRIRGAPSRSTAICIKREQYLVAHLAGKDIDRWTNDQGRRIPFVLDSAPDYNHNVIVIMLGEFEYLLITATARLGDEAYGEAIRQELDVAIGRRCSPGALYTTIDRLETKGLLTTWMGEATAERGGRAKRMVKVTAKGAKEAADFYEAVTRLSRGVSWTKTTKARA